MPLTIKKNKKKAPDKAPATIVRKASGEYAWLKEHLRKPRVFTPTGFSRLDSYIDGLYPENLLLIGGRPGQGKTTMMLNIIDKMKDKRHLVFPTENSRERWMEKFLSLTSGVADKDIRMREPEALSAIEGAIDGLAERNLRVVSAYHPTFQYIREHIENFQPDVLWFDYFQNIYMDPSMKGYRGYTEAVEQFHHIAIEYRIPVVLGSQLARPPKDRSDDTPRMSDLKETGKLEEAAKTIVLMHRDGSTLRTIVEKNRDGETGVIEWSGEWETNKLQEAV